MEEVSKLRILCEAGARATGKRGSSTHFNRSPAMERMALVREYEIYEEPGTVKTNPFIRKLHDIVGPWEVVEECSRAGFDKTSEDPPCLVFEWMEHVLWNVRAEPYRGKSVLSKMIARSVLEALDLFASANAMHTGWLSLLLRSLWWC